MRGKNSECAASFQRRGKVLIVDSAAENGSVFQKMLSDNYDILEAEKGLHVMEILESRAEEIDLVLLDLTLPETDGIEILRKMNKRGFTEKIPVVVVTAAVSQERTDLIYELGAIDLIIRPFDINIVCHRLENIRRLHAQQRKLDEKQKWGYERHLEAVLDMNPDVVGTFNFNISRNICSNGISDIKTVLMLQDSGTVDGYVEKAINMIPDKEEGKVFAKTFNRRALKAAYRKGKTIVALKHTYIGDDGDRKLLVTTVDMVNNPATGDIEGILYAKDITTAYVGDRIKEFLINKGYDSIAIVDLSNDSASILSGGNGEGVSLIKLGSSYTERQKRKAMQEVFPDNRERFLADTKIETIREELAQRESYAVNVNCIGENGEKRFKKFSFSYMDKGHEIAIVTGEDITYDAERDFLTGELNREGFLQYTNQILKKSGKDDHFTIIFFDVKGFKAINEKFGTMAGDELLRRMAKYIRNAFYEPVALARIAGYDHFLCLVRTEKLDLDELRRYFRKCTFSYGGMSEEIHCMCGIYHIQRDDGLSVSAMCDRARLAKEYLRDDYTKLYSIYNESMKEDYLARNAITGTIQEALTNKEFKVYYQPIYDAKTGRIASAEALVRWQKPDGKMLSPGRFIPVLEETGYVSQLDRYVTEEVKAFIIGRQKKKEYVVPISVNLSWMDFRDKTMVHDLVQDSERQNENNGFVRFEITETAHTSLTGENSDTLKQMRKNGTAILIDDFGSGYSSFSTIVDFDFDVIKLDMSFVQKIGVNAKSESIIQAIINMAHSINAKVIAEGAETREHVDFLVKHGCDYIQGFYFSKPLPREEFVALLGKENMFPKG